MNGVRSVAGRVAMERFVRRVGPRDRTRYRAKTDKIDPRVLATLQAGGLLPDGVARVRVSQYGITADIPRAGAIAKEVPRIPRGERGPAVGAWASQIATDPFKSVGRVCRLAASGVSRVDQGAGDRDRIDSWILGRAQNDVALDPFDGQRGIVDPALGQLPVCLEIRAHDLDDVVECAANLKAFDYLGAVSDALFEACMHSSALFNDDLRDDSIAAAASSLVDPRFLNSTKYAFPVVPATEGATFLVCRIDW
jgi:hypothetical protein